MCKYQYWDRETEIKLSTKKFIPINCDIDYREYERTFSGRMTKKRWQIIDRFCRLQSYRPTYRCGHEWDCCGCFCGQNMSFTYNRNQVVISFTQSFNY